MTRKPLRVCVVGAGAVGLVYAHHLQRGGAEVTLLVKPSQSELCADGFALHRLQARGRRTTAELRDLPTLTDVEEVAAADFDQVWLAVASDSLRGVWLEKLLDASATGTVVLVQPDLDDRPRVLAHISEDRLVQGLIGFLSFQSPLPGAPHLPAGIAYSLLPFSLSASTFDGARAPDVVAALRRGGFPARIQRDLPRRSAERSAATVPMMAGLEIAGWRLPDFVRGPWLGRSLAASREALAAVAASLARPPARISRALHPLPVRVALAVAPRLAPFDLEAYLQFHFTKVGPQTRLMLETYAAHARTAGGSSDALRRLRGSLQR